MLNQQPTADRLATVRSRISALEEEEARLNISFLENGDYGVHLGNTCNVVVEREEAREFDPSRLPIEVRLDPKYWTTRFRTQISIQEKPKIGEWQDDRVIDLYEQGGIYC